MLDGSLSSPLPPASLAGPDRGVWIVGSKRQTAQVLDRAFALRAHGVADRERGDQTPHAFAQLQREGRCCRPGQLVDVIDRRLTAVDEALGVLGLAHGRRSAAIGLAKLDGDHVILDLDGEHLDRQVDAQAQRAPGARIEARPVAGQLDPAAGLVELAGELARARQAAESAADDHHAGLRPGAQAASAWAALLASATGVRKPTFKRFQPLIATIASVSATTCSDVKWRESSS